MIKPSIIKSTIGLTGCEKHLDKLVQNVTLGANLNYFAYVYI